MLSVLARRVSSGRLCVLDIRVCVSSPPGGAVPSRKFDFMVTVEAFHFDAISGSSLPWAALRTRCVSQHFISTRPRSVRSGRLDLRQ